MLTNLFDALCHMILPALIASLGLLIFNFIKNKGDAEKGFNLWKVLCAICKTAGFLLTLGLYLLILTVMFSTLREGGIKDGLKIMISAVVLAPSVYFIIKKPFEAFSLDFKNQTILGLLLLILSFILNTIFKKAFFINLALIIDGFLFIANPVFPEKFAYMGEKRCRREAFTAGIILIFIGFIFKFGI